jgi:hypothetical protein
MNPHFLQYDAKLLKAQKSNSKQQSGSMATANNEIFRKVRYNNESYLLPCGVDLTRRLCAVTCRRITRITPSPSSFRYAIFREDFADETTANQRG